MASEVAIANEIDVFLGALRNANERALLLDYDGTLAPFHTNRLAALPYLGIPELLLAIIMGNTRTRVVLITGRPAQELKQLLPFDPVPEIWGSHGMERLGSDGSYEVVAISDGAARMLRAINCGLKAAGLGALLERKPGSIAIHWRGLSDSEVLEARERLRRVWTALRPHKLFQLAAFDGGMEVRLRTRNKGDAVREILAELPEDAPVAYLGDDYTDEDAFIELKGRGLTVLVREQYRETAAAAWIQPPDGVLAFLANWLEACGEGAEI